MENGDCDGQDKRNNEEDGAEIKDALEKKDISHVSEKEVCDEADNE